MTGKYFLIVGGALITLIGILFLFTIINLTLSSEDADNINIVMIVLSSLFIVSGTIGILTGALKNNNPLWVFTKFIGIKLSVLFVLLLGSAIVVEMDYIAPLYEKFGSFFGLDIPEDSRIYWISVLTIAVCIHIFLTGIEAAENDDWDAYIITRSVTRLLFLIFMGFVNSLFTNYPLRMGTLAYAANFCLFLLIFEFIRSLYYEISVVKMVLMTFVCTLALPLFIGITNLFDGLIAWFTNLTIFIPIIVLGILLLLMRLNYISLYDKNIKYIYKRNGNQTYIYVASDNDNNYSGNQRNNNESQDRSDEIRRERQRERDEEYRRKTEDYQRRSKENPGGFNPF
jgi:hypothetical protein